MGFGSTIGRAWFTAVLLFILALWICGSFTTHVLFRLHLLQRRRHHDLSIAIGTLCARLLFMFCPHVCLKYIPSHGKQRWHELLDASATGAAPLLLMNHTSFLDLFVMCAAITPSAVLRTHLRCIIAAKLTRLPLLGSALGTWSGNFPAYFREEKGGISGGEGSSFATDQTKQAAVAKEIDAHVASGGMLGICPEGTVNATPETLLPFRHGAFRVAIEHQMPIFAMITAGCGDCWPKRNVLGGLPATVYVGEPVHLLTPTADMDSATVAEECRRLMQEMSQSMRDLRQLLPPTAAWPAAAKSCSNV